MPRYHVYFLGSIMLLVASCKPSITPQELYGKWKYIKLENNKENSTSSAWKMKAQEPSIEFTKKDSLIMIWGGSVFAKGTFRTDGNKILFNQDLEGGRKYEYKFVVDEISDKQIVFETDGADVSKVTAVRE